MVDNGSPISPAPTTAMNRTNGRTKKSVRPPTTPVVEQKIIVLRDIAIVAPAIRVTSATRLGMEQDAYRAMMWVVAGEGKMTVVRAVARRKTTKIAVMKWHAALKHLTAAVQKVAHRVMTLIAVKMRPAKNILMAVAPIAVQ
jgi:hypothetical protein